ncbi:MAG: DNA mismatch repair protein MutS [Acidobacteria bacterium]|nr:DNA mismatch repair protein MutS [Acidobacteriota bacterium]
MTELRAIRQAAAQEHEKRHHRFGYLRLALGAMLLYAGWLGRAHPDETPWPFLIQLVLFMSATIIHSRVIRRMEFAQRSVDYYDRGLARLNGNYSKTPSRGDSFADPHHPFSGDLDLFGAGGLFERLCHARTREGESTLAGWLLDQAGPPAAPARLAAAAELADRVELREALAVLGPDLNSALHPKALREWSTGQSKLFPAATKWLWITAAFSAACVAASIALQALSPLGLGILLSSAVFGLHHRTILLALHETSHAGRDLKVLQEALALIENNTFESDLLKNIQSRIKSDGPAASHRIGKLATLAEWIDSLDNQGFRLLDLLFLFSLHFVRAADNWRAINGALVDTWLKAVGEFEALASISAWQYENPDTVAPTWTDKPTLRGEALRHPLIPRDRVITNDADLGAATRLLVVSGSNMSGKSTYLRTLGLNVVLAHAGATVAAKSLTLSPLWLGASIRTVDSLQEGASRFYAELQRLKTIVDMSGQDRKLLFLLDELLSGTNSHDRRIGAAGIVSKLLESGAIGLVTTHDLALADIASDHTNVHFEDEIVDGKIHFDYRMKPGVVRTSNALALMRAVGLDVPAN